LAYTPQAPTVSKTIELETARNNLQFAINHLHEIREQIGTLPIREVQDSSALTELWEKVNRIDLENLCDDDIPF
jgi:hypothetical protein